MSTRDETVRRTRETMPGQVRALLALSWYSLKSQMRSTGTALFGFVFPLAFIAVFGFVGGESQRIRLGVSHDDTTTASSVLVAELRAVPAIEVVTGQQAELDRLLRSGRLEGIVRYVPEGAPKGVLPSGKVLLRYSSASPQSMGVARLVVEMAVDKLRLRLSGSTDPPLRFEATPVEGRSFRYVDFALPGQLGFSLLFLAVSGAAFSLMMLKQTLVLKRLFVTPTWPPIVLCSQALCRLVVVMLHASLLLLAGVLLFRFELRHGVATFFEMLLVSMFGLVAFLGFGILIAGVARRTDSVSLLTNLFTIPQILLCGTFFSTDHLPDWLQPIASRLPLAYFNVAMRRAANDGAPLGELIGPLAGLFGWSLGAYVLAALTFRWAHDRAS